jgi:mono/diheme cytochrome c family protein
VSGARALAWGWVVCAVASCSAPEARAPATHEAAGPASAPPDLDDDEEPEVIVDGRYLYTRNCAGCHNDNGDGLGPTIVQLGRKARSFAEGHFAFGNTRESIFRTIGSGVPGSSPMPGFAGILSDDERWLVVDYVRTLMPAEPESDPTAGLMRVDNSPVVVRGSLPPIVEGAAAHPRGLLLGTPGGLSFEYRTDDVRLLGVRQGEFADRRDWNDRGGARLAPLGQVLWTAQGGDPEPSLAIIRDEARIALAARLTGSWIRGSDAGVAYTWSLAAKNTAERFRVKVEESCRTTPTSAGAGFTRRFVMRSERDDASVLVNLAGSTNEEEWVRGATGAETIVVGLPAHELPSDGWIVGQRAEREFECVHIRAPAHSRLVVQSGALGVIVALPADVDVALEATIVTTSNDSPELFERLSTEIR